MNTISSLLPKIKGMLVERLFLTVAPEDMPDDANIMDEYGVDSVALLELVVALEDEFGVVVEDGDFDIANFSTPSALAMFVADRIGD
jgi:acyl carrier protein